jgi:peptidoglycan/xylan/chitin deacetylase (PgdA/CDA1 family)
MKLIVTIDTEEDDWGSYQRTGSTLQNIEKIPHLQELFDEYNVKPTYLITYPVAMDRRAVSILKRILDNGKCEIGAHCHPWNTPPFDEENNEVNSMLCNISAGLQYKKLLTLHEAIIQRFGIEPKSFRAGRWGYNETVAENLYRLDYKVDTSISPFCDWSESYGPDFTLTYPDPYRIQFHNHLESYPKRNMIEIPASVGFLQKNFPLCNRILNKLRSKNLRHFHIIGMLYRLKLLNLVWLSPEISNGQEMISLCKTFMKIGYEYLNMSFHSTSLLIGKSPFAKDESRLSSFYEDIKSVLTFATSKNMCFTSLLEAGEIFDKSITENN